jgi:heme oxygenase
VIGRSADGRRPRQGRADMAGVVRDATRGWHLAVESQLALPGSVTGVTDYRRLLRFWREVWAAGEHVLRKSAPGALPRVSALTLLDSDLHDLSRWTPAQAAATGAATARAGNRAGDRTAGSVAAGAGGARPASPEPAVLACLPTAGLGVWGVGYVLQGSRLGGRTLAPALRERVGLPPGVGTRFLLSDGGDVGAEWAGFRARLREIAPDPWDGRSRVVLAGALATFRFVSERAGAFGWPAGRSGAAAVSATGSGLAGRS